VVCYDDSGIRLLGENRRQDKQYKKLLNGDLADYLPLSFVLVNGIGKEQIFCEMIRKWHYLGYNKMIGSRIKYLALSCAQPIAAISFNRASYHLWIARYLALLKRYCPT